MRSSIVTGPQTNSFQVLLAQSLPMLTSLVARYLLVSNHAVESDIPVWKQVLVMLRKVSFFGKILIPKSIKSY